MMFSTKDRDNDAVLSGKCAHCARCEEGAWWYKSCSYSNLNGRYLAGDSDSLVGITWSSFKGSFYSVRRAEMKIRPIMATHP